MFEDLESYMALSSEAASRKASDARESRLSSFNTDQVAASRKGSVGQKSDNSLQWEGDKTTRIQSELSSFSSRM